MSIIKQFSFAQGELAPACYGRVDMVKYATGLKTCRNATVMRMGGVKNREGTIYRAETKDSTKESRVLPWIFNASQTYVIEMGDEYMRFTRDGAQVTVASAAAWASSTSYSVADLVSSAGTFYYCKAANTGSGGNAPPNATYWHGLTGSIYEIPTPYAEADLFDVQYKQSADVMTLTHPSYQQRNLTRTGHTAWTLAAITMNPAQAAPTSVTVSGTAGANNYIYHVTAVNSTTSEESLAAIGSGTSITAPATNDHTISWVAAAGAGFYRVYIEENGLPSFIGETANTTFTNDGITSDLSDQPPAANNPFNAAGDYPSISAYFQQRQFFANTDNNPESVWGSRTGLYTNFTVSTPSQQDDSLQFDLAGNRVNEIVHLLELKTLIALTTGSEWSINGDESGAVIPGAINSKQHTFNGAANVQPVIINGDAIYLQARGYKFRSLFYTIDVDGYRGNDLTTFSSHLVDGYTIVDMDFQQNPHSVVYAVRSDGELLGMTYIREHEIVGWSRHDTDGLFESVCVVPEGDQDVPYFVVNRTINGTTKRYIESMAQRYEKEEDIKDAIYMDSTLSFDGRNTGATTMTVAGGTNWTEDETLTVSASTSYFVSGDVGNALHFYETTSGTTILIADITAYTSGTVVSVKCDRTVPTALRGVATTDWGKAVDELSGLDHLEAKAVSVIGDGFVIGSPNNPDNTTYTVTSGAITLPRPYVVIHVGLPYLTDIETLDIDTAEGRTLVGDRKCVTKLWATFENTRGVFVGIEAPASGEDANKGLYPFKTFDENDYNLPTPVFTGSDWVSVQGAYNSHGRVFLRQIDPLPMKLLAVAPAGLVSGV